MISKRPAYYPPDMPYRICYMRQSGVAFSGVIGLLLTLVVSVAVSAEIKSGGSLLWSFLPAFFGLILIFNFCQIFDPLCLAFYKSEIYIRGIGLISNTRVKALDIDFLKSGYKVPAMQSVMLAIEPETEAEKKAAQKQKSVDGLLRKRMSFGNFVDTTDEHEIEKVISSLRFYRSR